MPCAFAPVAPIQILEELYDRNPHVFGEYHLLLAHHTVEFADRFSALFKRIEQDRVIQPLVIMDNSVVECGGYVDFKMMREASNTVWEAGFDVIPVLPDVMGKGQATREATMEAYTRWEREMPHAGFMAVCQGESYQDYAASLTEFSNRAKYPHVEFLGIPRFLVQTVGTRRYATEQALKVSDGHRIHLLGYSDRMDDDLACSHLPGVYGIDSAVPLRVPGKFSFDMHVEPRPPEWFEEGKASPQLMANLGYVRNKHAHAEFATAGGEMDDVE